MGRSSFDHARSAVSTSAGLLHTVKARQQRSPNDNPRPPASDRIAPASSASNAARCRQLRTCGSILFERDALKASTSWHRCVPRQAGFHRELAQAIACSRHLGSALAILSRPSKRKTHSMMSCRAFDITLQREEDLTIMKVFPLRLHSQGLRDLVREVAASEHISQNELIEQAVAHEVLLRGATLVDDLERAAQRIGDLTDAEYAKIVDRSLTDFAEGEGLAEPLQAYAIDIGDAAQDATQEGRDIDSLGVMAAFDSAQTYSTQADSAQA